MKVENIDHIVLTVKDIEKTCKFYNTVLGMEVVTFGKGRTALRFGKQKINLHPVPTEQGLIAKNPVPGSTDICFITETPMNDFMNHLIKLRICIEGGPVTTYGATGCNLSVYFRDPDENLIEVANRIKIPEKI